MGFTTTFEVAQTRYQKKEKKYLIIVCTLMQQDLICARYGEKIRLTDSVNVANDILVSLASSV